MSATKTGIVSGGVLLLVLAGLYSLQSGTDERLPPAEVTPSPTSKREAPGRTGHTQRPTATPHPAAPPPSTGSQGVAEGPRDPSSSGIEEAFITARQDSAPQRRLEALRFLGEHALPKDLDALQQIQIQDPAPEVRRAAEEATQLLMARFSGQPWPGIPSGHNPSSYMKETASPQTP